MHSSKFQGPWKLNADEIRRQVQNHWPGNFLIGPVKDGVLQVIKIGGADQDLQRALLKEIDLSLDDEYPGHIVTATDRLGGLKFMALYRDSPRDVFLEMCRNFHDFRPFRPWSHPEAPEGTGWRCPVCPREDWE